MKNFNFEEAISKLEDISEKLEKGNLSLDEMISLYSEGTKLAAKCNETLEKAQIKITEINGESNSDND